MSSFEFLPFEIYCMIFGYLSVTDLKNASLTCRRWCQIIFSDYYIRRFMLKVSIRPPDQLQDQMVGRVESPTMSGRSRIAVSRFFPCSLYQRWRMGKDKSKCELQQMALTLSRSCRHYSNIAFVCDDQSEFTDHVSNVIQNLLRPSGLEQIETLKITLSSNMIDLVTVLNSAVRNMKRLKSLHLIYDLQQRLRHGDQVRPCVVIESETITHIELKSVIPEQVILPKLYSLDVNLQPGIASIIESVANYLTTLQLQLDCTSIHCREEEIYALKLDKLKMLKLSQGIVFPEIKLAIGSTRSDLKIRFLRNLTRLEKLVIEKIQIEDDVLQAICETCQNLEDLKIDHLEIVNCSALDKLSLLQNLKILFLSNISSSHDISFCNVSLPKLENLHLEVFKDSSHSFRKFANLKHLAISSSPSKALEVSEVISVNLEQLQDLRLNLLDYTEVPPQTFYNLSRMEHLRKLTLIRGYLKRDVFERCPAGVSNLETVVLSVCLLDTEHFDELKNKFHKLRNLSFEDCLMQGHSPFFNESLNFR